ncbi:MAG: peptidase E [Candidatus Niameybacter stercoravium]|nr:peptidase E [Candidatus Niameybacter stercoravium]
MGRIIAIGGGELSKGETYAIDKAIVNLSGKLHPKTLFIPTASFEPAGYCKRFQELYQTQLGAQVEVLYLLDNKLSIKEIEEKIKWADIIYVGGGDTTFMLQTWQKKHVDQFLKEAYERDTLLCGLSAGSICWFETGQSEIDSNSTEDGFDYIKLKGLGLINAFHCPHFNEGRRAEVFDQMIQESNLVGIALDNNCAIAIIDDSYCILTSEPDKKAYKVYSMNGQVIHEPIKQIDSFRKLSTLGISTK